MKKILTFLKNHWKVIVLFFTINILNIGFHFLCFLEGHIFILLVITFFTVVVFSFLLFYKFYKKLGYFILFLLVLEFLILVISFPACHYYFKAPQCNCKCIGIEKQMFGRTHCIGKRNKCYKYRDDIKGFQEDFWQLYKQNKFHENFEVPCEELDKLLGK